MSIQEAIGNEFQNETPKLLPDSVTEQWIQAMSKEYGDTPSLPSAQDKLRSLKIIKPERMQQIISWINAGNLMRFYNSRDWRKLRLEALKRDRYECQRCRANGKYHKAENVHHIKEVKDFPALSLTLDNLESLCIRCHNDEHKRLDVVRKQKFTNEELW